MKYTNLSSFKKSFENLNNKKCLFLIVQQDTYERTKTFEYILKYFNFDDFNIYKINKKTKFNEILNIFLSPSLLGGDPLVIIEDIEYLSKEDILKLDSFILKNTVSLIVGSAKKIPCFKLYNTFEKEGSLFDLSLEKIWEKEKRIENYILEKCFKSKKTISSYVIKILFEKVGLDLSLIKQELEKLIMYVGDKSNIELQDVQDICTDNLTQTLWQVAEKIVWDEITFEKRHMDTSFFHLLLSAIRYQLQIGYKISSLIEDDKSHEIKNYFPKIYPKTLEKKIIKVKKNKTIFYKNALKIVFDIDVLSKTQNLNIMFLYDLLKLKLLSIQIWD